VDRCGDAGTLERPTREVDFFDIKGVAEQVCETLNVAAEVVAATRPYLVEGRTAELRADGHVVGVLGQLDPAIAEQRDLPGTDAVYVVEIDLDALSARARGRRASPCRCRGIRL
jgi:phenylalanyl-tRNA synthetase beta chain